MQKRKFYQSSVPHNDDTPKTEKNSFSVTLSFWKKHESHYTKGPNVALNYYFAVWM